MTVEVITIFDREHTKLLCMVNLASLKNYKKLVKVDQYFNFGSHFCKISFKKTTLKALYEYQLPYEHFILAVKSLEENLQYKTNNTQTNNVLKEVIENINKLKVKSTYPQTGWLGVEYRTGLEDAIAEISKLIKQ